MTEGPATPERPEETRDGNEGLPRWVKIFAIVMAVLFAIFVAAHLAGGGLGHHSQ